jgi:hypothetical protein
MYICNTTRSLVVCYTACTGHGRRRTDSPPRCSARRAGRDRHATEVAAGAGSQGSRQIGQARCSADTGRGHPVILCHEPRDGGPTSSDGGRTGSDALEPHRRNGARGLGTARDHSRADGCPPRSRKRSKASRGATRAPAGEAAGATRHRTARRRAASVPTTAADAPEAVVKLLKSYDPKDLRWLDRNHRHLIVVAILTRGNEEAKQWLWSVLPEERVRELVRSYRAAGCAAPDRAELRNQLGLTTTDIPTRPYLGMERGLERERP